MKTIRFTLPLVSLVLVVVSAAVPADKAAEQPKAFLDGSGPDWKPLTGDDFINANCDEDTWTWKGGDLHCTGKQGNRTSKSCFVKGLHC